MKITTKTLSAFLLYSSFFTVNCNAQDNAPKQQEQLPIVKDFKPDRYLGQWYEVARLPTPIQTDDSLATAEYSLKENKDIISVKNTAYDKNGKKLSEIQGTAQIAKGKPPGRFLVSFGPIAPVSPNYYIIHVDKDYQYAVVGVPDRKSLWILSRKVPVSKEDLTSLKKIAKDAGFDLTKLIVSPWQNMQVIP